MADLHGRYRDRRDKGEDLPGELTILVVGADVFSQGFLVDKHALAFVERALKEHVLFCKFGD